MKASGKKDPIISIITATYNSERYLEQTIQSVLEQTANAHIEYILVDGASTDGTMKIVEQYRHAIDVVISEKDKGIYDAFNKGILASSGDFIYFLNSDDYLYDSLVIQNVIDRMQASTPETKAFYGNVLEINEVNGFRQMAGQEMTEALFRDGKMIPHQGLFAARELFLQYGLFDLRYPVRSDLDFMVKLFGDSNISREYMDIPIAYFRIGGLSSAVGSRNRMRIEKMEILSRRFGDWKIDPYTDAELNIAYYKKWIEALLFDREPVSSVLRQRNIRNVAVFGSTEMSLYVVRDLEESDISVHTLLDNNPRRQGLIMNGKTIRSAEWLKDHASFLDAIIFAFEGKHEANIQQQVESLLGECKLRFISWRQMVSWKTESMAGEGY